MGERAVNLPALDAYRRGELVGPSFTVGRREAGRERTSYIHFLVNCWYDLSLDLSFDPLNLKKAMAAIKLEVVPIYSILG